jgi:hypothetical protein
MSHACIFACACAVALLVPLFEASFKLGDAFLGMRQLIGGQGAGHVGGLGEGENGGAVLRVAGLVRAGWGSRLNKSRRLCAAAARRGQAQDTPPSTIIRREDPH